MPLGGDKTWRQDLTVLNSGERSTLKPVRAVTIWLPLMETTDLSGGGCFVPALSLLRHKFQPGGLFNFFLPCLRWVLDSQASVPGAGLKHHLVAGLGTAVYSCSA